MSRTACCFLALGIGVTLATACGDDDVDFTGMGGSGGRGGAAGTAGTGGSSGSAGRGGTGGQGGSAGQDGNAGQGGSAGTGGTGGTGGTAAPAISPMAEPMQRRRTAAGVGIAPISRLRPRVSSSRTDKNVVISRVVFEDGGATVTFRGVGSGAFEFRCPHAISAAVRGSGLHRCSRTRSRRRSGRPDGRRGGDHLHR